ncbi:hypothetical protein [Amedibacillus sp. YH-ame10]
MKLVYKIALSVIIITLSLFLMINDMIINQSLNIRNVQIFVLAITISLICFTPNKKRRILFGFIFFVFFVLSFACCIISINMFGTSQPIAAMQGYYKVVEKKDLYYVVPIKSLTYKYRYGEPTIFITQKINDITTLETILKDHYIELITSDLRIEEIKGTDNEGMKKYRISINSNRTIYVHVYNKNTYAWFGIRI